MVTLTWHASKYNVDVPLVEVTYPVLLHMPGERECTSGGVYAYRAC